MNLKAGSQLQGGRYIIDKVLGQGGFGITYLCEQTALLRKVAVKEFFMREYCERDSETATISLGSSGSREMVDRFRRKFVKEARAIAAFGFDNKHIVRIIDVFEENGTAYYVMEYVGGGSLNDKVKEGALTEAVALRYIKQVAAALDFVHSKRMMHLDIKPANILLNENDEAVLIDFGLAKQYDDAGSQTSTTPVGISHGYAPLEQYKRGGVGTFSPATDIYSLGATLYKLLTGNTPPEAGDVNDDGLPALPPTISPAVRNAVETAMQPRRKDRPQSISEFLSLLECHSELSEESLPSDDDAATVIADSATDNEVLHSAQNDNDCKNSTSTLGGEAQQAEGCNPNRTPVISTERSDGEISNTDYEATVVADSATDNEILRSAQNDKEYTANKSKYSFSKKLLTIISTAVICAIAVFLGVKSYNDSKGLKNIKSSGFIDGHEYVDLGLPSGLKWATCNVGASKPEEYGGYYAWGETKEKENYSWETYELCNGSSFSMTKYCTDSDYGKVDIKKVLDPEDDVAHVKWGGSWRMPTNEEQKELLDYCSWKKTTLNGIKGYRVTGPNGNIIFLPAAGGMDDASLNFRGHSGHYWSSTLTVTSFHANNLNFNSNDYNWYFSERFIGQSVRPVSGGSSEQACTPNVEADYIMADSLMLE